MSIESVMPSKHLILCHPLLLLSSVFPSFRVFSNESVRHIRWPKCLSFSFSISPSNEYSELISFRSHHCLLNFQFVHWFFFSVWIQFTITIFIQWVRYFFWGRVLCHTAYRISVPRPWQLKPWILTTRHQGTLILLLFQLLSPVNSLQLHGLKDARFLCPPLSARICSNSSPLSWWCSLTISFSATLFSFCLQSFPASRSFLVSQLFTSGDQSIGASASASIPPVNYSGLIFFRIDWFGLLAVQGTLKSLLHTLIQKHQFVSDQPSFLWSSSHICTWLLEKP